MNNQIRIPNNIIIDNQLHKIKLNTEKGPFKSWLMKISTIMFLEKCFQAS